MKLITHKVIHKIYIDNRYLINLESKKLNLKTHIEFFLIYLINSYELPINITLLTSYNSSVNINYEDGLNGEIYTLMNSELYRLISTLFINIDKRDFTYLNLNKIKIETRPGLSICITLEEV